MAMAIDHEAVIDEYKKTFLQTNQRQFSPKLYSELPETPQRELEIEGEMVGPRHPAFKLALTRMCDHHLLRQFGGVWRLAYGRFNPPKPPSKPVLIQLTCAPGISPHASTRRRM